MSTARGDILSAVRQAASARRAAEEALPDAPVLPARAQGSADQLQNRFCEMARFAGASVHIVAGRDEVPGAIAAYLSREALGDSLVMAADASLLSLPWRTAPRLQARPGRPLASDVVSLTGALAGIAETGSLLVASGAAIANALHVLCETHIVLLSGQDLCGSYEEGLDRLPGNMPRAATFITGPSRTADIEKTPQIGVHGPRRLHVLLIAS